MDKNEKIEKLMLETKDPTVDEMSTEELDLWVSTLKEDRESLVRMQRDLVEQIKTLDQDIAALNIERIKRHKWPKGTLRISTEIFRSF